MLSDVQSRKIAKYRKLAKKNVFCRYLATVMLIGNVILSKFFSFHRRRLVVMGQLCAVALVFLINTSFAPHPATQQEDLGHTGEIAGLDDLIRTNEETFGGVMEKSPVAEHEEGTMSGATSEVVFDKSDWKLLLVNKQHTIPQDYEFTLGTIKGSMRCDERIIEPLTQMFAEAKEDGVNLIVCSPYRDMARQEYLFERKVKSYQSKGMSYMDAYEKAAITVTLPGASEHQIGLAVDIISDTYSALEVGFADTQAGKWLAEHSWEYGFILRYPLGKEEITGIQFEPWHFRYVGRDAAEVITSQNITLEEFVENL